MLFRNRESTKLKRTKPHFEELNLWRVLAVVPGLSITKLMAAKDRGLIDQNGNTPDEIEMLNNSADQRCTGNSNNQAIFNWNYFNAATPRTASTGVK